MIRKPSPPGSFIYGFCLIILLLSCRSYRAKKEALPDNENRGTIRVSADESFKPIIDQQVLVYESNHQGAHIIVSYKPEAECLKDLWNDSVRMIIATRPPSREERESVVDSLGVAMESMTVARDAITVIVNPRNPDSLLTMQEVKDILTGRFKKSLIPVFDGVKATSTVRFIIDSVLRGDSLTPKAVAARSSEGVIDYVSKNQDVVGFIGVSWIGNPEDSAQTEHLKNVNMAALQSTYKENLFIRPSQANIYIKRYPMVRDLVYTVKEKYKGLGQAFADFMSGEIGQLIFRRAYLVPAQKNFGIRPVRLRE
ncbi:MAG TPA: substrate-binding domain-containing protein [Chitinophagaceae bacterium]|nr:substrate-binding domain-containing protein [Chitinophagaceae bacterium]